MLFPIMLIVNWSLPFSNPGKCNIAHESVLIWAMLCHLLGVAKNSKSKKLISLAADLCPLANQSLLLVPRDSDM